VGTGMPHVAAKPEEPGRSNEREEWHRESFRVHVIALECAILVSVLFIEN
jgi:hypothetical protein